MQTTLLVNIVNQHGVTWGLTLYNRNQKWTTLIQQRSTALGTLYSAAQDGVDGDGAFAGFGSQPVATSVITIT